MSKGYKKEYVDKVKAKFNDLQSGSKQNPNAAGKPSNDKHGKVRHASGMASV